MFTQKISMDCTKEQYEKYLKEELLRMGYEEIGLVWSFDKSIIVNNWAGYMGDLASLIPTCKDNEGRLYLGSFNAPLFLALAAMTDKAEGNYGEYVIGLNTGSFYRMSSLDKILPEFRYLRKATKEEIMAKFGEKEAILPTIAIDITTNSDEKRCYYGSEEQMIALLKSKGYKIMRKTETWEEV